MKSLKYIYSFIALLLILVACNDEQEFEQIEEIDTKAEEILTSIKLVNDKLKFDSKEALSIFMNQSDQSEIKKRVDEFSEQGFKTLRPFFHKDDEIAIDNFLAQKQSNITKKGYLYSSKIGDDEIDLDDEVVSDANFASILNENREIYVGDSIYIYTTLGLYVSKIEDEQYLKDYLSSENSKITSKSQLLSRKSLCDERIEKSSSGGLSLAPITGSLSPIDSKIMIFEENCDGGSGGSGGSGSSGGSGGGTTPTEIPILKPMSFGACDYSLDSIWQKIFGERVKCNDYHDSTHRIQTQFWNENYLLWASIGMKAKYQKKRFIGWSESGTSDFVELGINTVKYTWNHPRQYNPFNDHHVKFKYKGVTYNSDGTQNYALPKNPNPWPIYNEGEVLIPLEITIDDILGVQQWDINWDGVTAGDINNGIKELLKMSSDVLGSQFRQDLANNKVMVSVVRFAPTKTDVIVTNRIKRGSSSTEFRFDTNFLLSFDSEEGSFLKILADQLEAKTYTNVEVDMYGAALREGVWKGKRILGED